VTDQADLSVTEASVNPDRLILSIFPGVDLFSKPFEERGFCVVRGPDLITGQDIRSFHVPSGVFAGVIGGSPCQEFSALNRNEPTGYGEEMLNEFHRIVQEASPKWWLLENVARVPDLKIDGYSWQRFPLDLAWFSDCSRLRHFQFGHCDDLLLDPPISVRGDVTHSAALASDGRSFSQLKAIQGLPADYDLPSFTVEGKKRAVGNGVPLPLGRVLSGLVDHHVYGVTSRPSLNVTHQGANGVTELPAKRVTHQAANDVTVRTDLSVTAPGDKPVTLCGCGCGRTVYGRASYAGPACRKRASRSRQ
jgi:DNA (cytosine-5)-methyltransferase 1